MEYVSEVSEVERSPGGSWSEGSCRSFPMKWKICDENELINEAYEVELRKSEIKA